MKRIMAIALGALFIAPALFAAGGKEAPAQQKTVTIRYWDALNEQEQKFKSDWTRESIALYEAANPNIKIELTASSNGDQYLNKLSTAMAANDIPDLMFTWTAGRLEPFVKAGRLMALNDVIAKGPLAETINIGNTSATTFDGKIYAIPNELAGEVIYYNKALFAKAGLTPPKTWEELLVAVKKFRSMGISPFSLANRDPWPGTIPYMAIFDKLWGPEEYKKTVFNKQPVFDSAPYIKAADYLTQLVKAGAYPDNFNSLDYGEGVAMFGAGQAAMRYNGTWELPDHIAKLGADLGIMNWPLMPNGKGKADEGWLTLQNQAFAISATSTVKDETVKFLEFLFSKERQKVLAEGGWMIATKNIPFDQTKVNPAAAEVAKYLSSSANPILIWDVLLGQNLGKELNITTQAILQGADATKAFADLNKAAKAEWGN